jgi:hypothetical protein
MKTIRLIRLALAVLAFLCALTAVRPAVAAVPNGQAHAASQTCDKGSDGQETHG